MDIKKYDPTIQGLLAQCDDDWGDPEINQENLIPFGIPWLDEAVWGIDVVNGELDMILGAEKNRKTTFVANVIANIMTLKQPVDKPTIAVDTLESGMNPKRYRDALISIMASRYLFKQGHKANEPCPVCRSPRCKVLQMSPEFLRYNPRTAEQLTAIEYARDTMASWPLFLFGANPSMGNTRSLAESIKDDDSRWHELINEYGVKIFVVDHVQQYTFADEPTDYEKQLRAVSTISDKVAMYQVVVLMLSQVSLNSLRDVRSGAGRLNAAGGTKGQQEANLVLSTRYQPNSGVMQISIEESRRSGTLSVWQPLDDTSGAFYGTASNRPPISVPEI